MISLSFGEWIAIVGVVVSLFIGVVQIAKSGSGSDGINVKQSSGLFSRTKQKINIKVNKNDG